MQSATHSAAAEHEQKPTATALPEPIAAAQQEAHPHQECRSFACVRAHCQAARAAQVAAGSAPMAAAAIDELSDSSPDSTSPTSTRSGTSPGYANDWSLRPTPLAVVSDKPDRTRSDKPVRQLADATLRPTGAASGQTSVTAAAAAAPVATSSLLQRRQQQRLERKSQESVPHGVIAGENDAKSNVG